ncbi:MAG TPA: NTP transferase domain-containing protein [Acidocella sp.]|nr:NTP transferase domain-containing protein [Acidocella sp.]
MRSLGVLLAAGASRRFGPQDKLLAPYRGAALVRAAATSLLGAGCDAVLAIVSSMEVAAALPAGFEICRIAPGQMMAASFQAAIDQARARQASRLLVCLGDMPNVKPALLRRLAAHDSSCACQAGGIRTPPMLLAETDYAAARDSAQGDRGARRFLATLSPGALIDVDPVELRDIDQPGDITGV